MILIALSAAVVGFVHSLSPGHWLPVVLLTRLRKWNKAQAFLASLIASSGHILISSILGLIVSEIEMKWLATHENSIERFSGLGLIAFGLIYALWAYSRHHACHGHSHHGPKPPNKHAFIFLFTLGFSPCVAALPLFAAAALKSGTALVLSIVFFCLGVILAFSGATLLATFDYRFLEGKFFLDDTFLEHNGDVITGGCVALVGVLFVLGIFS